MLPNVWPIFNLINIIKLDEKKGKSVNDTDSYDWYFELFVRHLRLSTYLFVAYVTYYFTFPSHSDLSNYDSNDQKLFWWLKWAVIIILRDQIATNFFYGGWHYILFDSSLSPKMKKLKFNPQYPKQSQWSHDRFWTLNGTVICSFFELFMIYIYCRYNTSLLLHSSFILTQNGISIILWLLFIPYWRDFHFYWIHRMMHKWNWKLFGLFDPGYWLYKYAHSLHHKSYNTGPWSGLSMHPIEHLIYYSCVFVPMIFTFIFSAKYSFIFKQHVIHLLFNKWHLQLSPLPGHDGFDAPGGGSYFHYLHHAHFECNFGTPMVPFDKIFGTYEDGSKYRKMKKFDSVNEHKD